MNTYSPTPGSHDPYVTLRMRDFRHFMLSGLLKTSAQQFQGVAVGWEVYRRTGSALNLGFVGLATAIPTLGLSLFAGQVADRFNRKKVMLVMWSISAMAALMLAALSYFGHAWPGWLWAVYATLFINGAAMTFARPAWQSLLPQIVPADNLTNAVTWNSSSKEVSSMVGPALAGAVLAISLPLSYLFAGVTTLIAVLQIARIRLIPRPSRVDIETNTGSRITDAWHNLTAGVRFVWNTKLLLAAMTLDMLAVLFGGATYLLPIFADKLGVGAVGFGGLRAAPAVGAFAMALFLAHRRPMQRAGPAMLLAVAGYGLATIVFGLSHWYILSLTMLVITGSLDNISVVIRHSLIQLLPADGMRGRVSAVNMVFVGASDQLGGVESGLTAAATSPVISVVGGGIATICVVIATAFTWPQLWRLGALRDVHHELPNADIALPPRLAIANA